MQPEIAQRAIVELSEGLVQRQPAAPSFELRSQRVCEREEGVRRGEGPPAGRLVTERPGDEGGYRMWLVYAWVTL